jgi:beta-barrel assembly-enhancing protease
MLVKRIFSYVILTTILVGVACAARQPGTAIKPGFNLFSKEQDVQLGREASQQVLQQYEVVQNPTLQNYLRTIGERLAATPEARGSGFPFSFTLVNDRSVNAFALPGGPMFVFTGLLNAVDNEAQLAGVMAHEMSHVILRHGTNQASKANLLQIPAVLAGATLGRGGSMMGQLAQLGIGLGFNSVLLKFSRNDESQADAMGAQMAAEAGYNPLEMARFFEKLEAAGGSRGPEFLSDHPNPGNREKAIEAEIRGLPQRNYNGETGQFSRMKAELRAVPAPSKRGRLSGSALPPEGSTSGGMQEIRNRYFTVQYPDGWRAYGDNGGGSVTIAPSNGLVETPNGSSQVGYGAILSYFTPDGGPTNLRDTTNELIHHLHANNPQMQVDSSRRVRVDGRDGLLTMLTSASPYGGDERDGLLTILRPEGLFYMIFIAPSRNFRQLEGTFNAMITSLRFNG